MKTSLYLVVLSSLLSQVVAGPFVKRGLSSNNKRVLAGTERIKRAQWNPKTRATRVRRAYTPGPSDVCSVAKPCTGQNTCVEGQCYPICEYNQAPGTAVGTSMTKCVCDPSNAVPNAGNTKCVPKCKTVGDGESIQGPEGYCSCPNSQLSSSGQECIKCTSDQFLTSGPAGVPGTSGGPRCADKCTTTGMTGTTQQLPTGGCLCADGYGRDTSNTVCGKCDAGFVTSKSTNPDTFNKCVPACTGGVQNEDAGNGQPACQSCSSDLLTLNKAGNACIRKCNTVGDGESVQQDLGYCSCPNSELSTSGQECIKCGSDEFLVAGNPAVPGASGGQRCGKICTTDGMTGTLQQTPKVGGCLCGDGYGRDPSNTSCGQCDDGFVTSTSTNTNTFNKCVPACTGGTQNQDATSAANACSACPTGQEISGAGNSCTAPVAQTCSDNLEGTPPSCFCPEERSGFVQGSCCPSGTYFEDGDCVQDLPPPQIESCGDGMKVSGDRLSCVCPDNLTCNQVSDCPEDRQFGNTGFCCNTDYIYQVSFDDDRPPRCTPQ